MSKAAALLAAALTLYCVTAHPLCLNNDGPSLKDQQNLGFCKPATDAVSGSCCNAARESGLKAAYDAVASKLPEQCKPLHAQVLCGSCSPYEQHLYAAKKPYMAMCSGFCNQYVAACGSALGLPADFCGKYASNDYYCYPVKDTPVPTGQVKPYFYNLNGRLPTQMTGMYPVPGSNKLWITSQTGIIYEVENDPATSTLTTVLNIRDAVKVKDEMGLLGLAIAPDFATSGRFYINYIDHGQNTVIARFTKRGSEGETRGTRAELMRWGQWQPNHNGGTMLFTPGDLQNPGGKSGYDLYIMSGDGGSGDDPRNYAQNLDSRLGKVLRITVPSGSSGSGYTVPGDNTRGEVWAWGLRNPWKCSFDRSKTAAPELYCGDVGQNRIEKITRVYKGRNHGWRNYEGTRLNIGGPLADWVQPIFEYCHGGQSLPQCNGKPFTGQSVTGGYVYTGSKQSDIYNGDYIFADYQAGHIGRLYRDNGRWVPSLIMTAGFKIQSLAEDHRGELYILRYGEGAQIYALPNPKGTIVPHNNNNNNGGSSGGGVSPVTPNVPLPGAGASTADPTCAKGIIQDGVCCSKMCGNQCGGFGCEKRAGGADNCCMGTIKLKAKSCANQGAPCVMSGAAAAPPAAGAGAGRMCSDGIRFGDVCCPKGCGQCGGFGCDKRAGGDKACCSSGIKASGKKCASSAAPCMM